MDNLYDKGTKSEELSSEGEEFAMPLDALNDSAFSGYANNLGEQIASHTMTTNEEKHAAQEVDAGCVN